MADYSLDPCVEQELRAIWRFIAQDNPEAATRVVEPPYSTFGLLAANPGIGRKRRFQNPRTRQVRSWAIRGFDNYLIFYRPVPDGVQVLHVFHGARDINSLFAKE